MEYDVFYLVCVGVCKKMNGMEKNVIMLLLYHSHSISIYYLHQYMEHMINQC